MTDNKRPPFDTDNNVISRHPVTPGQQKLIDRYTQHQSKAGKRGGRSRSPAKIAASRANLAKVRAKRHNPVTGPQTGEVNHN